MGGQEFAELVNNKAYIEKKNVVNVIKRIILSKFLVRNQVDFFWQFGTDSFKINPDNVKLTIINCIKKEKSSLFLETISLVQLPRKVCPETSTIV